MTDLSEEELQELYAWIDEIPLSRQKKNIARDFSDGVLAAEVIHHFLPKLVELHNYSPANAIQQKVTNWQTLNRKVLSKLNFLVPEDLLQGAANGKQGVIEFILITLRSKIENYLQAKVERSDFPSDNLYHDPLYDYPPVQMLSSHQPMPSWDAGRHTEAAQLPHEAEHTTLNRTYPSHTTKLPLLPSRIPVASRRRDDLQSSFQHQPTHSSSLPPLGPNRHDSKSNAVPPLRRRHTQYSEKTQAPNKSRDSSAKYKLRLAEKDQKILETHEYIQFLQMKLTRYEHLVHVKDMKIEELKKELEVAKNAGKKPLFPYNQRR